MDEAKADFFEQQAERGLLYRTGKTRLSKRKTYPTRKEWEKMNGAVETKQLPELPSVRDRLLYITAGLSQSEIAARIGITASAVSQQTRHANKMRRSTLEKYADAFGCPVEWLCGSGEEAAPDRGAEDKAADAVTPTVQSHKSAAKKASFRLDVDGVFDGRDLPALLSALPGRYKVRLSIENE